MSGVDFERTALIAVDLQNEGFSEGVWPVHGFATVLANARKVINAARARKVPIVYTRHWLDPRGFNAQRYEPVDGRGRPIHSVAGTWGAEIAAAVAPRRGDIVIDKQRFTAFHGTNLDLTLRRMAVEQIILLGVWTEACLETTFWDALWRDYRILLVKDACGSSTETMHRTAILDMANWNFGGRIFRAAEMVKALQGRRFKAWTFERSNAMAYDASTIDALYESI
jgi:nicotinamidase-related amidase